jgi:hypothetical protein
LSGDNRNLRAGRKPKRVNEALEVLIFYTRQAMNVSRNSEVRPCNYCCSVQAMSITQTECIVALGIQHAMRMLHIVIGGLPDLQYVFTLSHKRHDLRGKKVIEHKMCVK